MKDLNYFTNNYNSTLDSPVIDKTQARTFLSNVFGFMFLAIAITGGVAYWFAHSGLIFEYLMNESTGKPSALFWIVSFAPLGLVFLMSLGYRKLSTSAMIFVFLTYALLNGLAFSTLFLGYNIGDIYLAFGSAALVFGLMSIVGYTTKTDLSKLGSILMIALVAIIIMMIINWFIGSSGLDYMISIGGVIIFTGLTAWDVQKLKRIGAGQEVIPGSGIVEIPSKKRAVYGALSLYLDFINLFLFLLRLFASRD